MGGEVLLRADDAIHTLSSIFIIRGVFFTLPFCHVVLFMIWRHADQLNVLLCLSTSIPQSLYWLFTTISGRGKSSINIWALVNKRLCYKSKKTAGKSKHELPDASDYCMVGMCHKKLLLGTKSLPKDPWGDKFLVLVLMPWESLWND